MGYRGSLSAVKNYDLRRHEWFYVLGGNLTAHVGDTRLDLTAGGFAFGPKSVPHTFIGAGPGPTRLLVGFAPMQFEGFLRKVGHRVPTRVLPPPLEGPPPDLEQLAPIAKRNGFINLGPRGPPRTRPRRSRTADQLATRGKK